MFRDSEYDGHVLYKLLTGLTIYRDIHTILQHVFTFLYLSIFASNFRLVL